jgi:PadR family transcriptional regulator, regulatory protein PadR
MSSERELLKGSLELMLLALLSHEPLYGYRIVREVRARSAQVLNLREGSLYPALHRLEGAGLIEGYWQTRDDGADRRYYRITGEGRVALAEREAEWRRFVAAVDGVIGSAS